MNQIDVLTQTVGLLEKRLTMVEQLCVPLHVRQNSGGHREDIHQVHHGDHGEHGDHDDRQTKIHITKVRT